MPDIHHIPIGFKPVTLEEARQIILNLKSEEIGNEGGYHTCYDLLNIAEEGCRHFAVGTNPHDGTANLMIYAVKNGRITGILIDIDNCLDECIDIGLPKDGREWELPSSPYLP